MINSDNLKQPTGLKEHESMTLGEKKKKTGSVGWSTIQSSTFLPYPPPYRAGNQTEVCESLGAQREWRARNKINFSLRRLGGVGEEMLTLQLLCKRCDNLTLSEVKEERRRENIHKSWGPNPQQPLEGLLSCQNVCLSPKTSEANKLTTFQTESNPLSIQQSLHTCFAHCSIQLASYPLSTPNTRFNTKKEPNMMRLTK